MNVTEDYKALNGQAGPPSLTSPLIYCFVCNIRLLLVKHIALPSSIIQLQLLQYNPFSLLDTVWAPAMTPPWCISWSDEWWKLVFTTKPNLKQSCLLDQFHFQDEAQFDEQSSHEYHLDKEVLQIAEAEDAWSANMTSIGKLHARF